MSFQTLKQGYSQNCRSWFFRKKERNTWKAEELYSMTLTETKRVYDFEKHPDLDKLVGAVIKHESEGTENEGSEIVCIPFFALRAPFKIRGKRISNVDLLKILENLGGKYEEFGKNFLKYELKINSNSIAHTEIENVENVEKLAELFENLNTTLVKLSYFDIMRSSFANFKYSTGEFLDIKEIIEEAVNKHDELKALSMCVDKPYEYASRGFNFYSELKNGKLKIGVRRSKGSVNIYGILNDIYKGSADEDDEYLVKILPEKIVNSYSSNKLRSFIEDLENTECQNGGLNIGIDSFEIMLLVQSLVNEGENLFTLDGKSITKLFKRW